MKLIAYGSLLDQPSMEKVLDRPALPTRVTISGVRRVYNAPFDGYAYLNLALDPASTIEAVWYDVHEHELHRFAEREAGSILMEVMPGHFAFVWPADRCADLEVPQTYIDFCTRAAAAVGVDYARGTITPERIYDDRHASVYEYHENYAETTAQR